MTLSLNPESLPPRFKEEKGKKKGKKTQVWALPASRPSDARFPRDQARHRPLPREAQAGQEGARQPAEAHRRPLPRRPPPRTLLQEVVPARRVSRLCEALPRAHSLQQPGPPATPPRPGGYGYGTRRFCHDVVLLRGRPRQHFEFEAPPLGRHSSGAPPHRRGLCGRGRLLLQGPPGRRRGPPQPWWRPGPHSSSAAPFSSPCPTRFRAICSSGSSSRSFSESDDCHHGRREVPRRKRHSRERPRRRRGGSDGGKSSS